MTKESAATPQETHVSGNADGKGGAAAALRATCAEIQALMAKYTIEDIRALASMFWNGNKDDRRAGMMLHSFASFAQMMNNAAPALLAAAEQNERLRLAIRWALGYEQHDGTDFRERQPGEGAYWWRKELRTRTGLSDEDIAKEIGT